MEVVAVEPSHWSGVGEVCSCQGNTHAHVTNCLSCGKVICEVEMNLPCTFCKTPHGEYKRDDVAVSKAEAMQRSQCRCYPRATAPLV